MRLFSLVLASSIAVSCTADEQPTATSVPDDLNHPFPEAEYLWAPIGSDAAVDVASDRIVQNLLSDADPVAALLQEYAIPILIADERDPIITVTCSDERDVECDLERDRLVRIPVDAQPNAGDDGALVVLDMTRDVSYELWRARRVDDTTWTVEWGAINDLGGDGISDNGGSGSGLSRLVGIPRISELDAGSVDHALAVASSETCETSWRWPAWSSDGDDAGADCLPMGARLQLDPALVLDELELTGAERLVAQSLQTYGAIVVDSSATPLAFFFEQESPTSLGAGLGEVATGLGFRWDYDPLVGIPWDRLRVLAE